MNLTPYIDRLRHDLAIAAEAGGDDARAVADRLAAPLESAAQLMLLEALSAAAEEITLELAPGSVEVRLRGRDPDFVVTPPPPTYADDDADLDPMGRTPLTSGIAGRASLGDEGGTARLNLRLPDTLKARIDHAAGAEGLSLNAWLIRAAATALEAGEQGRHPHPRSASGGERFTGWVR